MEKRRRDEVELRQIEMEIESIMDSEDGVMLNQESKDTLVGLVGRRNTQLLDKEETWRLKSRAIWLACGDENTKKFHAYAKGRKAVNTIWILEDDRGRRP